MVRIRVASTCGVIPILEGNMCENGQPGPSGETVGDRNNGASGVSWPSFGNKSIDGAGQPRTAGWTEGCEDGWMERWGMDGWMNGWMSGWPDGGVGGGRMDRWTEGGMGEWADGGWMVEWWMEDRSTGHRYRLRRGPSNGGSMQ